MIGAAVAVVAASGVHALELDSGNPDLKIRADATIRYNFGVRTEAQDQRLLNFATTDEGNAKFGRGDVVSNRLDLLGGTRLNYKGVFGARVSAASWYDHAYRDRSVSSPAGQATSYNNNRFNDEVNRFVHGPSGEILMRLSGPTSISVLFPSMSSWAVTPWFGVRACSSAPTPFPTVSRLWMV
jgi:hypothetical protein